MDFSKTETQQAVSGLARKIFKDKLSDQRHKELAAADATLDDRLWKDLATSGLLGTAIADAHGGSAHGMLELCSLMIEAGGAAAPVPLWPTVCVGALAVAEFGSNAQNRALLDGVVTGKTMLSAAFLEPGAPDPMRPRTRARRADDGTWRLDGHKTCVPYAAVCERVLVPALGDDDALGVFLIDPQANGVTLRAQTATGGEPQADMELADVVAEPLGAPTGGRAVLDWLLPRATVTLCAAHFGVARYMLRTTAKYTSERKQFDRPIGTFQAVSQRAADAYIDVETIGLALWEAAWRLAEGLPADDAVDMAKFWAAEAGHRVAYAAQHLHGGIGFDLDYPLARYYMLSKQLELTLGSATVHLQRIGQRLAAPAAE